MQMATARLTNLLPTAGYLLPYALSLFFASLILTFAGAFLTLDRTRSFEPASDVFQDRQKSTSRIVSSFIRGGIGGILAGFVFGVHFTTFLSLLIPSVTSSQPLKPAAYVSVWLLSSLVTSIAAGRWKYFGFVASGFCGGASMALAISVTIHPTLLTRIALVTVLASTLAILTPLPITRLQSILLRTSTSAVGSFGLVLSIALFSRVGPWSNVWERLWVHDDIYWGSVQEKGLSASFFLFFVSGIVTDWWLRTKFGESPDQKWDSYLAQYAANLPAESNRAGVFHPFASMWSKPSPMHLEPDRGPPLAASQENDINFLRKSRRTSWPGSGRNLNAKTRGNVRFRPVDDKDPADSEAEERVFNQGTPLTNLHPPLAGIDSTTSTHCSTPTLLEEGAYSHVGKDPYQAISPAHLSINLEESVSDLPDYSDHEADIASDVQPTRYGPGWTPRFLQDRGKVPSAHSDGPHANQVHPSAGRRRPSYKNSGGSTKGHESPRWQAFWRDVNEKIHRKETP